MKFSEYKNRITSRINKKYELEDIRQNIKGLEGLADKFRPDATEHPYFNVNHLDESELDDFEKSIAFTQSAIYIKSFLTTEERKARNEIGSLLAPIHEIHKNLKRSLDECVLIHEWLIKPLLCRTGGLAMGGTVVLNIKSGKNTFTFKNDDRQEYSTRCKYSALHADVAYGITNRQIGVLLKNAAIIKIESYCNEIENSKNYSGIIFSSKDIKKICE